MLALVKMNPKVKAKWVEALRSGKYQQTTGMLKNMKGEMCCLGVLCEIYHQCTRRGRWALPDYVPPLLDPYYQYTSYSFGGNEAYPPREVADWSGLDYVGETYGRLGDMNDLEKKSFSAIADFIEQNL